MAVWLDMDGVLASFDARATEVLGCPPTEYEARHGTEAFWDRLHTPDFFLGLALMPDARELWDGVVALTGRAPAILTATPKAPKWEGAAAEKVAWAARHFPGARVITCRARDKALHCAPGDALVDDQPTHRALWEAAGGVWVAHVSAAASLVELARVLAGSTNLLATPSKLG